MRIFIIGNFVGKKVTGVQRVAVEVTKALIELHAETYVLCREGMKQPDWLREGHAIWIAAPDYAGRGLYNFVILPWWLSYHQRASDVVINFSNIGFPWIRNLIVCIHDCAVYQERRWFGLKFLLAYRALLPFVSAAAACVTTVSRFSRKEIKRHLPWASAKTQVISNAASPWWRQVQRPQQACSPYFLVVGSMDPRKRLGTVVTAWELWKRRTDAPHALCVVGGSFDTFARNTGLGASKLARDVKYLGYVSDEELRDLYAGCQAVINASRYEGFGLPLLEARAAGARVIASDIEAFLEIGDPGFQYFRADDAADLAAAIERMACAGEHTPADDQRVPHTWRDSAQRYLWIAGELARPRQV